MKSTMKSAFAIIAVALMIMVAVVPMVGVVNGDDPIYDPIQDTDDKITLQFRLYTTSAAVTGSDYVIKVTWGTDRVEYLTTSGGTVTKIFDETKMTNVKAVVGKGTGTAFVQDADFSEYTNKSIAAGTSLIIDLLNGYSPKELTLNAANDTTTTIYSAIEDILGTGDYITVQYKLYKADKTTAITAGKTVAKLDTSSKFSIYYPSTETVVYAEITGVKVLDSTGKELKSFALTSEKTLVVGTVTTTSGEGTETTSTAVDTIATKQFVFTVGGIAGIPDGTISELKASSGTVTSITVKDTIGVDSDATFFYTADKEISEMTYAATFGSVKLATVSNDNSGGIDLNGKAIFGTFQMGAINAADGTALKFTATDSSATAKTASENAYVNGGYFISKIPTITSPTGEPTITASSDFTMGSSTINTNGSESTVVASTDGFTPVSGKVSNAHDGYAFSVTLGAKNKVFGLAGSNTTYTVELNDDDFSFYMIGGTTIQFKTTDSVSQFDSVSSAQIYVPVGTFSPVDLELENKYLNFVFMDGDGELFTMGGTDKVHAVDALGASVDIAYVTGSATLLGYEQYELTDATYDVSKLKVWFTNQTANTFAAYDATTAVAYTEVLGVMPVSSLETTYYVFVKDAAGNVIAVQPTINNATAYVAEDGTKIYTTGTSITPTHMADGSYAYRVSSALVDVTLSGVSKDVVILTASNANYIFQTAPYLATSTLTITAKADSITATIFKTDGVTPIANTMFELKKSDDTVIDVQTTDANGSITFTADAEIPYDAKIVASSAKIGDIDNILGTTNVKSDATYKIPYSLFYASYDVYKIDITDADGKVFDGALSTNVLDVKVLGTSKVLASSYAVDKSGIISVSLNADVGDVLAVTLAVSSGGNAVRTFDGYVLTADDVKNGTISLVSNESTYTLKAVDADGKTIKLDTTNTVVKSVKGGATPATITPSATVVNTKTSLSTDTSKVTYVITAPASNVEYVAHIVASDASYTDLADASTDVYDFTDNVAIAESALSTITFELVDAEGKSIKDVIIGTGLSVSNVAVNGATVNYIVGTNKVYFIGDADGYNQVTFTAGSSVTYSFKTQYLADGIVKAKEQTVVFTAVDAAGVPLTGAGFTINKVAANGAVSVLESNATFLENGICSKIMAVDSTVTYQLVKSGYTFTTDGTKFTAAEQTVYFKFAYANGFAYDGTGTVSALTIYYKDGTTYTPTSFSAKSITLDTTNVASYALTVDSMSFAGTDGNLKCDKSKITGYVPSLVNSVTPTYKAVYYNGSVVVKSVALTTQITGNTYTITPDFVNGGFDKVVVQCLVNGIVYSQATLDAKTGYVADLTPVSTSETLNIKIVGMDDSGSVDYVAYAFADGKVYLSVTDKYTRETVDGMYVETYKFAGWYVNGVKTSEELTCIVDNVSSNVVFASFVLDDSKELGKESTSGVDPTVLAIGIAAVIIALIAVVYTVIQKKE